jgi:hypothetical protein
VNKLRRRAGKREPPATGQEQAPSIAVGPSEGRPKRRPRGAGESEGRIRVEKPGNDQAAGPGGAKAARAGTNFRRET